MRACVCVHMHTSVNEKNKQTEIFLEKVYCESEELLLSSYCNVRKPEAETLLTFQKCKISRKCSNSESWLSGVPATRWAKTYLPSTSIWSEFYTIIETLKQQQIYSIDSRYGCN